MILQVILAVIGLIIAFLLLYFLVIKKDDKKTTNPVTIAPKTKRILRLEERFDKAVQKHRLRFSNAFHDDPPPVDAPTYETYTTLTGVTFSVPVIPITTTSASPPPNPYTGQPFDPLIVNSVLLAQESFASYPCNLTSGDTIMVALSLNNPPTNDNTTYYQEFSVLSYDNRLIITDNAAGNPVCPTPSCPNNTLNLKTVEYTIPPGQYYMTDLLLAINVAIATSNITFTQDPITNQITMTDSTPGATGIVIGGGTMNTLLGLTASTTPSNPYEIPLPQNINQTFVLYLGIPGDNLPANWDPPLSISLAPTSYLFVAKKVFFPDYGAEPYSAPLGANKGFTRLSKAKIQYGVENGGAGSKESISFQDMVGSEGIADQAINTLDDLYPLFTGNFTSADLQTFSTNVGLLAIETALAVSGRGFFVGPIGTLFMGLATTFGWYQPQQTPEPDYSMIYQFITNNSQQQVLSALVQDMQLHLWNVRKTFWEKYYAKKINTGVSVINKCIHTDESGDGCDPISSNMQIAFDMKYPRINNTSIKYDPTALATDNTSSSQTPVSKRTTLNNYLNDNNSILYQMLFSTGLPKINLLTTYDVSYTGIGFFIRLAGPYLDMLTNMIGLYQERSLNDVTTPNYVNPYLTNSIGEPSSILNTTTGTFTTTASAQTTADSLLYDLQQQCMNPVYPPTQGSATGGSYTLFIIQALTAYANNLQINYTSLQCSWWDWFSLGGNAGRYPCGSFSNGQCIPKYTYQFVDRNAPFLEQVQVPIMDGNGNQIETLNWYEYFSQTLSYNNAGIYTPVGTPKIYVGNNQCLSSCINTNNCQNRNNLLPNYGPRQEIRTRIIYYTGFSAFLSNPCNQLILMRKMAGLSNTIQLSDGSNYEMTGDDVWSNLMYWDLISRKYTPSDIQFFINSLDNPNYNSSGPSYPTNLSTATNPTGLPNTFDLSGGYPFGMQNPSYKQAIQEWINKAGYPLSSPPIPPANPFVPMFGTSTNDDYNFNNFCTPMVSVNTNDPPTDLSMFNIPGDSGDSQGNPWNLGTCTNPNNVGVISCLKAMAVPGAYNAPTANSRSTFCVDSNGNTFPITVNAPVPPAVTQFSGFSGVQYIVIPPGVTSVSFELWGGGGAGMNSQTGGTAQGGGGGYVSGSIPSVNAGRILSLNVGFGAGASGVTANSETTGMGGGGTSLMYAQQVGEDANGNPIYSEVAEIATAGGGGGASCGWSGGASGQQGYKVVGTPDPAAGFGGNRFVGGQGGGYGASPAVITNIGNSGMRWQGGNPAADYNGQNCGGAGGGGGSFGGGSGGNTGSGSSGGIGSSGGGGSSNYSVDFCTITNLLEGVGPNPAPGATTSPNYPTQNTPNFPANLPNVGVGGSGSATKTQPNPGGPGYGFVQLNFS